MNRNTITIAALFCGVLAAIFFVSIAFNIFSMNVALFLGVAAALLSGFFWSIRGRFSQ